MEPYALDIETTGLKLVDDEVLGAAICNGEQLSDSKWYPAGEKLAAMLKWLTDYQIPVICHNGLFDVTFLEFKYPGTRINMIEDTACLCLMADNSDASVGYSLDENANRYLGMTKDSEDIIIWLNQNGFPEVNKKNFRGYMKHIPISMVAEYCMFDAFITKMLRDSIKPYIKVNPDIYTQLFIASFRMAKEARMNGVPLDMGKLRDYENYLVNLIENVTDKFFSNENLKRYIDYAKREEFYLEYMKRLEKSTTGNVKQKDYAVWSANEKNKFNIGSGTQLKRLFDAQGLYFNWDEGEFEYPAVSEKTGDPTFDGDHIGLYGEGGEILDELGNAKEMLIRVRQIYNEIGSDGVWRPDYNLTGARSGRISTSGSNLLAFPVREKRFAECIKAPPGELIMIPDFVSLEPAIQAHVSKDKHLRYCIYDGVGKRPFYDENGILWIDCIYLHVASYNKKFRDDLDIDADLWMIDSDAVKEHNKPVRTPNKTIYLAWVYGSQVDTLKKQTIKKTKRPWTEAEIREVIRSLKTAFPMLYMTTKRLQDEVKAKTYFTTEFGFPLTFASIGSSKISTKMHKCLNRKVQGTAAGVMKTFQLILLNNKPDWMKIVVPDWHDAFVGRIPVDKREEAETIVRKCNDILNSMLKWEFPLRISVGFGENLYAAKG